MDNTIFNDIVSKITDKKMQKTLQSLAESYKPTAVKKVEDASNLAVKLYFTGNTDAALQLCEYIGTIPFKEDFRIWTWVNRALVVAVWIYRNRNQKELEAATVQKVKGVYDVSSNELIKATNLKVVERRLHGSMLNDDKIKVCVDTADVESEVRYRINQFCELLFIYCFGGSTTWTIEKLIKEIQDNEQIICQKIK